MYGCKRRETVSKKARYGDPFRKPYGPFRMPCTREIQRCCVMDDLTEGDS